MYNSNVKFATVCATFQNFASQHHSLSQRVNFDVKVLMMLYLFTGSLFFFKSKVD